MSEHTPGPWYADAQFIVGRVPTGRPGGEVIGEAKVFLGFIERDVDHRANARLMAAAPDLLEALEDIARGPLQGRPPNFGAYAQKRAKAAVSAVKGGTQEGRLT